MERLTTYNFTQYLMKSLSDGFSIYLDTISGRITGVVIMLDAQGPYPSVFLKHPQADNGTGVLLNHVTSFGMAKKEHQPNTVPNEDGAPVTVL